MQHLVFGAGLIGCYLGACFSRHAQISLVCRDSVRNKLNNGITLTDYQHNQYTTQALSFVTEEQDLETEVDVIWLTVKCTAVEQACVDMRPFVSANTVIMCAQNGLGSDHIVAKHFPHNTVLRVMVPFNVVEMQPGHFHRGSQGTMIIETNKQVRPLTEQLVTTFNCGLLPLDHAEDMTAILWAKLQLNLGNSVNALANVPVKTMLEQRPYRLIIAAMMRELLAVTKGMSMTLPKVTSLPANMLPIVLSLPDWLFKRLANKMLEIDPQVRTSMWWDISARKNTEIDFLNGAIVEHAKKLSIPCPINEKIIHLIKELEKTGLGDNIPEAKQLHQDVFG